MQLTRQDDPELPRRLRNLSCSYQARFNRFGEIKDLESALEMDWRAVYLTREDAPDFPLRLSNLAIPVLPSSLGTREYTPFKLPTVGSQNGVARLRIGFPMTDLLHNDISQIWPVSSKGLHGIPGKGMMRTRPLLFWL